MTIFEYILVLYSVILSLALTRLATGVGELVRSRKTVRWSLPYALWIAFSCCTILDLWSSTWLMRGDVRWSLGTILVLLADAIAVFMASLWLIPRDVGDDPIDLHQFMLRERRQFLGAFLAYMLFGVITNVFLLPGDFDWATTYIVGPMTVCMVAAWWSPRHWIQFVVPIVAMIAMVVYFTVYFPSIG